MKIENKYFVISFVILFILFLLSFAFNVYYNVTNTQQQSDTTIVKYTKIDTIKDTVPTVKYTKEIYFIRDTMNVREIIHDTLTNEVKSIVDIPIVQKTYSDDSTYTAYVSGYKPQLDSIYVFRKETFIEKTITNTKKDNKHFGIGPVIFGGYGFQKKQLEWGIGVGISYNIIKF